MYGLIGPRLEVGSTEQHGEAAQQPETKLGFNDF
jgi:hypothetical protein